MATFFSTVSLLFAIIISPLVESQNPIDSCWRTNPKWDLNRRALAGCAVGFGKYAAGGKDGSIYVVTSSEDDPENPRPGTLRHAVIQSDPLWITFAGDMSIVLKNELIMNSDKTIDGRGAKVMLLGHNDNSEVDESMKVTIAFNYFGSGLSERIPRVRRGYAHVANNRYDKWESYAIGGSADPTIFSEGNYFVAPDDPSKKQVTKRLESGSDRKSWKWISSKDVLLNGAYFEPSSNGAVTSFYIREEEFSVYDGSLVPNLTSSAGPLSCYSDKIC
ncbi:hypothetical protein Bca4012_038021 [Brassica carinata]